MAGRTQESPRVKYICRHCKVQVVGKSNPRAIYGRAHSRTCPRRNK